jgi:hypothetical protein
MHRRQRPGDEPGHFDPFVRPPALVNAKLLGGHFRPGNSIRDLLKRDISCVVGSPMVRLFVDTERGEPTIVRRSEPFFVDVIGGDDQLLAYFLG